ncbi:MAG: bifunctional metallophosphatase/5'-nucleotidase [Prevotella sp.]|nr:bifunctional metallophosphatase/5'-nucleotidase [Prevotella sp.]
MVLVLLLSITIHAEKRDIHILATNDMHAQIGVFPQLAALIDSLRTEDPSLLVFSAGDNRTGNPLNDKHEISGYPMVALMNQVGFNGSTLGNHEFDANSLSRLIGLSNFRYICANVFSTDSAAICTVPYQVFDVAGLKVGVIGVIQLGPKGIPGTHPDNLNGIWFTPAMEAISEYSWLHEQCDVTILLSHLGYPDDIEMTKIFPWFDLIIGGHTHTQLKGDEFVNGILITQNKNKFGSVTYITLTLENGKIVNKKAEYIDIKKYPKKNKLVESMVDHFSDNPNFKRVLATAETPFESREELGCLMCDAFMAETGAEIAVENPGGVRIDSHPAGDITVRDILEMDPFENNAVVLELTGDEILKMIVSYSNNMIYSFPYVGGMKCELTIDKTNPSRFKSVRLFTSDGKKFDMKRKYRVATNSYIPATSKIPDGSVQTLNIQTTDLIMQYLEKMKTIDYRGVRRLEFINN